MSGFTTMEVGDRFDRTVRIGFRILAVTLAMLVAGQSASAQGIFLNGVGSVNRSMGGAATAAPIDSMGALHWNPASIRGLPSSEIAFSAEMMLLDQSLESQIPGLAAGSNNAESGVVPIPAIGLVHHVEGTNTTLGIGLYSFAGFLQNHDASMPTTTNNPILFPQSLGGFGPLYSEAQFFQIVPTVAVALTDQLSVGVAPTLTMAKIAVDPLGFAGRLDDGTYPPGRGSRYHFGGGFQLGAYYAASPEWQFGASIKSPQWFEDFRFTTISGDPLLPTPTVARVKIDLPMVISLGAAYQGIENWLFAVDARYWDYKNTDGFGDSGFTPLPEGRLRGLGFSNIFSAAFGAQHRVSDCLSVRLGYSYNQDPISDGDLSANVASPLIQQHQIGLGASWSVTEKFDLIIGYSQIIEAENTGPIKIPGPPGQIPGATLTSRIATYSVSMGAAVRF